MAAVVPSRKHHIDALVLAFQHSSARELVGTDALRTVISGHYHDMLSGGTLSLEPLWEILEAQPGFSRELVIAPLCRYKTWEGALGVDITLPTALAELEPPQIHLDAEKCRVPAKELDRALERGQYSPEQRAERISRHQEMQDAPVQPTATEVAPTPKPWLLAAVSGVALIAFAVAGYFVFQSLSTTEWASVETSTISDIIPVKGIERHGHDVGCTLNSDSWFATDESGRRTAMREAMSRLSRDDVKTFFVRDSKGAIRAVAQTYGESSQIRVEFRDK